MANVLTTFFSRLTRPAFDGDGNPRLPSSVSAHRGIALVAQGATLVDVREKDEWRTGHAPRAIHIPLGTIEAQAHRIPRGRPVVVMCASGSRSRLGASMLRHAGLQATSLNGGITAWRAAGGDVRAGR